MKAFCFQATRRILSKFHESIFIRFGDEDRLFLCVLPFDRTLVFHFHSRSYSIIENKLWSVRREIEL